MNRNALVMALVLSILQLTGCTNEHDEAIRKAYMTSARAIELRDSQTAMQYISDADVEYYDELLKLAREGTPEDVQALSLTKKSFVAEMRHGLTAEQLQTFDVMMYLKHAIDSGLWATGADPRQDDIKKIRVGPDGTSAIAEFDFGGGTTGSYAFVLVDGVWKYDTIGFDDAIDEYYREMAIELDVSPEEVILIELEEETGKKVRKDIWTRPY